MGRGGLACESRNAGRESVVLQLWVIALLATVYLHDQLVEGVHRHVHAQPLELWRVILAIAPYLALAGATQLVCWACGKEIDRRGSLRSVLMAERMLTASRLVAVITHILCVFTLGWVEQVRALVGDPIMIDELLAVSPPLLSIIAGWWSFYPIEQRLHHATWLRVIEEGHPAYPMPTRRQFVWSNIRHQLLFILVPIAMIGVWSELSNRSLGWLDDHRHAENILGTLGRWLHRGTGVEGARLILQLCGVGLVFLFAPVLMRFVWDAVPLGPGPLRDRLMAVCTRANVKVRELLVWRTYGTMINGAAMGLIGPLRYILLTDGLLDNLPARQAESVMAHEVGHAKHHHIPWSVLGMIAMFGFATAAVAIPIALLALILPRSLMSNNDVVPTGMGLMQLGSFPFVFIMAFAGFGWVSRRFEWQADAFAAQTLSRDEPGATAVTQESADAMCGALGAVARLNHMNPNARSFRHGSITTRQRRLQRLVGTPLNKLPIDRIARWTKVAIVLGVGIVVAGTILESFVESQSRQKITWPRWMDRPESTLPGGEGRGGS